MHAGGRNLILQAFEVHAMISVAEQNFLLREVVLPAGVVCVFPVVHLVRLLLRTNEKRTLLICLMPLFIPICVKLASFFLVDVVHTLVPMHPR